MWAAFAVAAACSDRGGCSCSCDDDHDTDRHGADESYESYRPPRTSTSSTQNPGKPVLKFAAIGIVIALVAFLMFRTPATAARAVFAEPVAAHHASEIVGTLFEPPVEQPAASATDEPLTQPAPLVDAPAPATLDAETLVSGDAILSNEATSSEPAVAVGPLFFDVGSTREQVIAAQGPPTYAARHQRTLWWGSSRVEFDEVGRVRSWMSGAPALQVR